MKKWISSSRIPRSLGSAALAIGLAFVTLGARPDAREPIVIKLATLAPNGSAWHEILKEMGARWSEASGQQVELRIYPGGVAGEEADVLRKMRIGQLHAGSLTITGLSRVVPEVYVLAIPMTMRTDEDLQRVREVMQPRLEERLAEAGYVLLNWGDVGWVRFFLPTPDGSIEAVKKLTFPSWSDDSALELWRAAGFRSARLNMADMLPGLQTGMIDAVNSTPLVLLSNQWFPYVPYMLDMPWNPLVGATVVDRRTWEQIPESLRPELLRIARETGQKLRTEIQKMERDAIAAMEERGLTVIQPTEELVQEWTDFFEETRGQLRGRQIPAAWFDEVLRLTSRPG